MAGNATLAAALREEDICDPRIQWDGELNRARARTRRSELQLP